MFEVKILESFKKLLLNPKKDKIVIGVSGGPDSIALLHFLFMNRYRVVAAHLNHCLRGKDSDDDQNFVKGFCASLKVPFVYKRVDIKSLSKEKKLSIEEAGRIERYKFFDQVAEKYKANKIALAHHADDNIETFLMRLLRGTGIKGLCGIPIERDKIIRPMINVFKEEIYDYLKRNNLTFREDLSNLSNKFLRNRIRNQIIPALEKENPQIKGIILNLIKGFSKDYSILQKFITKKYKKIVKRRDDAIIIPLKKLRSIPNSLVGFIIRTGIADISGNLTNISSKHIDSIIKLEKGLLSLPNKTFAIKNTNDLVLTSNVELLKAERVKKFNYQLKIPGSIYIKEIGKRLNAMFCKRPKNIFKISGKSAIVDFDKLDGDRLIVRNYIFGDKFVPLGMKGEKKLQDFFVDIKIPQDKKHKIPVICDSKKIVWIAGHRISDLAKIDASTKRFLKLSID